MNHLDLENEALFKILINAKPRLLGLAAAIDVIPGMERNLILHAGPPINWSEMSAAMKAAVAGALVFDGQAPDLQSATHLAMLGAVRFAPAHDHQATGAMSGIVTSTMPVFVVEESVSKVRSFVSINEGLGQALRFGANGPQVLERLHYIRESLAPLLNKALQLRGPVDLASLIAEALRRGDECHNRNKAATALFLREIAPALVETRAAHADIATALRFIIGNDHFFLSLSMAHAKAVTLALEREGGGSLVTVMAGNGREVGIRTSGTSGRWFTAPAEVAQVRLFEGRTLEEATPTMGDSLCHRSHWSWWLCALGRAGDRGIYRWNRRRTRKALRTDAQDNGGRALALRDPAAWLSRRAGWHRRLQSRRCFNPANRQYRRCILPCRRWANRRGHSISALGAFCGGRCGGNIERTGREAERDSIPLTFSFAISPLTWS